MGSSICYNIIRYILGIIMCSIFHCQINLYFEYANKLVYFLKNKNNYIVTSYKFTVWSLFFIFLTICKPITHTLIFELCVKYVCILWKSLHVVVINYTMQHT